jgi:competence protein ComEC
MLLTRFAKIFIVSLLLILNGAVWVQVCAKPPHELIVSILDVGQGDSILVTGPTGVTMLVDGGPDHSVLRDLGHEFPFFKRSIDLVVETHPDKDHIAGLVDVLSRYQVANFMSSGMPGTTAVAEALREAVTHEPDMHTLLARRGMRIYLGGGAYADVLYPDKDVSKGETNAGSVVLHVVYGTTSFMLTGDLPSAEEDYLAGLDVGNANLPSTVLKAGHHGSKNSTDNAWLSAVNPKIVAISAGKDNRYGHPNPDTISRIQHEGATILSTITQGTIHFVSNGSSVSVR